MSNNELTEKSILTKAFGETSLVLSDDIQAKYDQLAKSMTGVQAGFEEVANKWSPGTIRIVQAMTGSKGGKPDGAKLGDLYTKSGLVQKPLRFVLVYAWPTRVRFSEEDEIPSCSSENVDLQGKGPADKSVSIYGDKCAQCPFDAQPFRYGKPTNCNNVMNALLVPESIDDINIMPFTRTSWSIGRQLVDLATAKHPPWSRFFSLTTRIEKRQKGGGEYAIPEVSPIDDKTTPVPAHLQAFAAMLSQHYGTVRAERKSLLLKRHTEIAERANMDTIVSEGSSKPDFKDGM